MNKILVSDIINLNNEKCILEFQKQEVVLNISGNVILYLINELPNIVNINLNDNSNLTVYLFSKKVENNVVFNINQNNNTNLNFNISIINNDKKDIVVNNNINGNNNKSLIKARMVSNNDLIHMIINVLVNKNTFDNIALEDLKGINNGGFVCIEPNIICLSNEVEANHLTTIGSFNDNELNYLMSKGLNEKLAIQIMLKGFIYSNMDNYIKNMGGD